MGRAAIDFELERSLCGAQFIDHLVVRDFGGFDHLDSLVHTGVKRLPFGRDCLHSKFRERILQLLVDQFDAAAKLVLLICGRVQGALEAIQRWKK